MENSIECPVVRQSLKCGSSVNDENRKKVDKSGIMEDMKRTWIKHVLDLSSNVLKGTAEGFDNLMSNLTVLHCQGSKTLDLIF